jgi:lauroyl/myristoyl acyltransferase
MLSPERQDSDMASSDPEPRWRYGLNLPAARLMQARDLGLLLYLATAVPIMALLPEHRLPPVARAWTFLVRKARRRWAVAEAAYVARLRGLQPDGPEAEQFFGAYLAHVRLAKLLVLRARRPGGWHPRLRLEGEDHLRQALAAGRGAILWVAPFLFSPLGTKMVLHRAGHSVSHLSRYSHGYSQTVLGAQLLNPVRTGVEDRYLAERIRIGPDHQPQAAVRTLSQRLRDNRIVSITAGAGGSRVVEVPFLAGQMALASGAPALALQTGAALLPVITLREADGGFVSIIHQPLSIEGQTRTGAQLTAARAFAVLVAEAARTHPAQFWWHTDSLRQAAQPSTGGP